MTSPHNDGAWAPSPELLAAYFDGEFEGRDELAILRQRLEDWLALSARGRAELGAYRRLRQSWLETTPAEPAPAAWQSVLSALERRPSGSPPGDSTGGLTPRRSPVRRAPVPWKAFLAGAACVLWAVFLFKDVPFISEDDSPFLVASAREADILEVDGADTATLVVGELPLEGMLELVGPGDVVLTSIQPAEDDLMIAELHVTGLGRPMIWARAETE